MVYLNEVFENAWRNQNLFDTVEALEGTVYRALEARRTIRFDLAGKHYFAKIHAGVGWREILKNCLQLRKPVLGASNEWLALRKLKEIGIQTLTPVAYGLDGWNPAKIRSFIVTEALEGTISLEDHCKDWPANPPPFAHKKRLINRVATISRLLHENGINHRDYYICHFLLDRAKLDEGEPALYLIDLHRAQIRATTPLRWRVKDIGELLFSVMDLNPTERDFYRFIKIYTNKSLPQALAEDRPFWQGVMGRARRLYLQDHSGLPEWFQRLASK